MSAPPASAQRIDTSHIKSPRDAMTPEERKAVRQELRESSEAVWQVEAEHGSIRDELYALYGSPLADPLRGRGEPDAA